MPRVFVDFKAAYVRTDVDGNRRCVSSRYTANVPGLQSLYLRMKVLFPFTVLDRLTLAQQLYCND